MNNTNFVKIHRSFNLLAAIISIFILCFIHTNLAVAEQNANNYPSQLVVAVSNLQDKPYYYIENHRLIGADIELMQKIAEKLNVSLKWRIMPFFRLEQELNTNNVHLAISMISANEERQQKYLLSKPYAETSARFIFKNNKVYKNFLNKKYNSLFVSAVYGTSYDDYLIQNGFSIRTCVDKMECKNAFLNNEANAGLSENNMLSAFIEQEKNNPNNKHAKDYVLSDPIFTERLVILTQKNNTTLIENINKAIQELDKEGALKKISKKYFNNENVYKYFDK